jgi:hypothetical protein
VRTGFHLLEGRQPWRIVGFKMKFGLPVIIRRPQKTVHGGADVAQSLFGYPARPIAICDPHPLGVPAFQVARDHARPGLHHFADATAALLSLAQAATELIGEPRMLRPMVPAERLVVRAALCGNLFDGVFGNAGIGRRHRSYPKFKIVNSMLRRIPR